MRIDVDALRAWLGEKRPWVVAVGFATHEEIRPESREVSAEARNDFGSWEEFGPGAR
jgi:hypothetical protein